MQANLITCFPSTKTGFWCREDGRSFFIIHYMKGNASIQAFYCYKGELYSLKKLLLMFYHCFWSARDVCCAASLLFSKIRAHVMNSSNINETWGGGVKWDAGGDGKQLISRNCFWRSSSLRHELRRHVSTVDFSSVWTFCPRRESFRGGF